MYDLGITERDCIKEVQKKELVADFESEMPTKTAECIRAAKEGVLLVDEAYRLTPTSTKDFGQEAIDTIMSHLEDHKEEKPVFIFAGYHHKMEEFLDSNMGFRRRVGHIIHIQNYTDDDLAAMTRRQLYHDRYKFPLGTDFKTIFGLIDPATKAIRNASLQMKLVNAIKNVMNRRLPVGPSSI